MELISTDDYFILQHLQRSETSLWVCRKTGKFSVRPPWDLCDQENPECLGLVWGIYGKLDIHPDVCQRLVLVKGKLKLPCFFSTYFKRNNGNKRKSEFEFEPHI